MLYLISRQSFMLEDHMLKLCVICYTVRTVYQGGRTTFWWWNGGFVHGCRHGGIYQYHNMVGNYLLMSEGAQLSNICEHARVMVVLNLQSVHNNSQIVH